MVSLDPSGYGFPSILILCSFVQLNVFSIPEQGRIVILYVAVLLKGAEGQDWLEGITLGSCIKGAEFRIQMESRGIGLLSLATPNTHRPHFKLLRKEKYGILNSEFLSGTFH